MQLNAKQAVNHLLMELATLPSHRFHLRGDDAHPLLISRLREMAQMNQSAQTGTIEATINKRSWAVTVTITAGPRGEEVELTAREQILTP